MALTLLAMSARVLAYLQEDGTMAITVGQDIRNLARVSDEFGSFPMNFKEVKLPSGWWHRAAEEEPRP